MIWTDATLLTYETETDRLGNEIPTDIVHDSRDVQLRYTPWTDEQILADLREVTKTEQQFAVPLPYSEVKDFTNVRIDDVLYKITETQDLAPRWSVLRVKVYKK